MKEKFYSLKNILAKKAHYNIIFGERSNGKTYAVLELILKNYVATGKQGAILRRWREDFIGKRGQVMFNSHVATGLISKLTKGAFTDVYYQSSKWFLCKYENEQRIMDVKPFCYGFSITSMEHDKSTSYPDITTVVFDEFISRQGYVNDEYILFMNTLSTIIRQRSDVTIFMLGNTVNKYCPYFKELGLTHILKMQPGDIDIYKYGESELKVAVEYTKPNTQGKASNFYFAFNNPKLQMITGGAWEIDIYPHLPERYEEKNILFQFFIVFESNILHCEIVDVNENIFIYVHPKTTPLKDLPDDLIYTTEYSSKPNYRRKITKPTTPMEKKIAMFFTRDKVFYYDNDTGEIMRNYLLWCDGK